MAEMKLSKNETPEMNITIPEQVNISIGSGVGTKDHSKLKKLDFDESGHTGFQRELTFDSAPTADSVNPVTSGGVKTALDEKANVKIPTNGGATSVSGGSVLASIYSIGSGDLASLYFGSKVGEPETGADSLEVPSYGLTTALLGQKQDKLTFDTTPTAGSSNPVTSDGIRAELDGKVSTGALADLDSNKADKSDVIKLQETVTQLSGQVADKWDKTSGGVITDVANYGYGPTQTEGGNYWIEYLTNWGTETIQGLVDKTALDYVKNTLEEEISAKADSSNVYTKSETDNKLNNKQDTLTFDSAPTQDSNNPVTSGGIFNTRIALESQISNAFGSLSDSLDTKANSSDVYTKSEIDSMIGDIEDAADGIIALQETYIGG